MTDFPASMGKVAPRGLRNSGIENVEAAANYTEQQLLAIHGVGPKAIAIIKQELAKSGKKLRATR